MAYHVQLFPAAVKQLSKLARKIQERITEELAKLADDPRRIEEIGIIADRKDVYRLRYGQEKTP